MEEKPDDLEITSIGDLYKGPWEKKYWSSSRGKDRYPYPIGYRAVRTHAGSTYTMEIREGLKGPLFAVTSVDGDSSTGQTPDIAWVNLQKKSGPKVKNWHGRRFSGKIDGIELFGFRNSFVQRLLRQLVANVNELAEQSIVSSNFCDGALGLDGETRTQHSHAYPDLLPYLGKQQSTGKRSRKTKHSFRSFSKEANIKRNRLEDSPNIEEDGTFKQLSGCLLQVRDGNTAKIQEKEWPEDGSLAIQFAPYHLNHSPKASAAASDKYINKQPCKIVPECENGDSGIGISTSTEKLVQNEDIRTSPHKVNATDVAEEKCHSFLARDEVLQFEDSECFPEKHAISHGLSKVNRPEDHRLVKVEDRCLHANKEQLHRLADTEVGKDKSLTMRKDNIEEISVLARFSDVCIPDVRVATSRGTTAGSALECNKENPFNMKSTVTVPGETLRASESCGDSLKPLSMSIGLTRKSMHPVLNETCSTLDALSKEFIKDSLPEVSSSSDSPNPSAGRIDLDLVGQELARSMMTFLLPQAVPLLKTYVKRRSSRRKQAAGCDPCPNVDGANSAGCNLGKDLPTAFQSQGSSVAQMLARESKDKHENIIPELVRGVSSLYTATDAETDVCYYKTNEKLTTEYAKSIIPDSFEGDQHMCFVQKRRSSCVNEADTAPDERKLTNHTSKLSESDRTGCNESSSLPCGNDGHNDALLHPEELVKKEGYLSNIHHLKGFLLEQKSNDDCIPSVDKFSCHNDDKMLFFNPSSAVQDGHLHFSDCLYSAEEEVLKFGDVPLHVSQRSDKDEHLQQDPLASGPNKEFGNIDALMIISPPCELVDVDVPTIEHTDANVRNQDGATCISPVGLGDKTMVTGKDKSFSFVSNIHKFTGDLSSNSFNADGIASSPLSSGKCHLPLSKSTFCRYTTDDNGPGACISAKTSCPMEKGQARQVGNGTDLMKPVTDEFNIDRKALLPDTTENGSDSRSNVFTMALGIESHISRNINSDIETSHCIDPSLSCFGNNDVDVASELPVPLEWRKGVSISDINHSNKAPPCLDKILQVRSVDNDCKNPVSSQTCQRNQLDASMSREGNTNVHLGSHMDILGCYLHPYPVLHLLLRSMDDYLQVCVLCGDSDNNHRTLFMYMIPSKDHIGSCPPFLGYTSLVLPPMKDPCYKNIPFERSGLHLTPERQSLVFLNSIKAPHCREQNISCMCSNCRPDCSEQNALEVAQVKFGYVSTITKIRTVERLSCILVCEPSYLIAAEVNGRLHVWIMNCTWSANLEEFMLPNFDCISPAIQELKRIPKCNSLVIGHNGIGGFGLWDIYKRVLLSRFSSPGNMFLQIIPIGLSNWQDPGTLANIQDHNKGSKLMENDRLSKNGDNHFIPPSGEDIAVWLLISTAPGPEGQHDKQPITSPFGWRLALLVKNMVVVGSILDPRSSAVDASANYGISGTYDGLLYTWKVSTGEKIANIHSFKCGGVSQITVDDDSGALAACSGHQLLIFAQTWKEYEN